MTSSVAKTCFDAIRAKQSAVVAGYDPIVVDHQDVYKEFLLRAVDSSSSVEEESESDSTQNAKIRTRRQTPLVNAGYASRVLSISYAIRSFVSYHKLVVSSTKIRIVLLGCGVDVIGLWARSLVQTDGNTMAVRVIEIDKAEVCSIKRKMIVDQGMVNNLVERCTHESSGTNEAPTRYYTGSIVLPSSLSNKSGNTHRENCNDDCFDYVLIPGDLNDTSKLESIICSNSNCQKEEVPTLVVSELVLSYLPPSSTDRLLRWCADRLCTTSDSALISLEPLGSPRVSSETSASTKPNSGGSERVISVEEGYQRDYCKKFNDKMERGRSTNRKADQMALLPSNALFHPIGSSTEKISSRLKEVGFSGASSTTSLGVISSVAAASASKSQSNDTAKTLVCPEIFDEHAALILHLQSYAFACGFIAPQAQPSTDLLFRRLMCPWVRGANRGPDLAMMRSGLPIVDPGGGIVYNEIEVSDETSVRSLFQNTYDKNYTDKYPAIRKMVKAALNNDMRATAVASMTTESNGVIGNCQGSQNASSESPSAIGDFYRSSGGIFIVAVKCTPQASSKDKIECQDDDHSKQSKIRQVVGCVGIRSHEGKDTNSSRTLEIFRLAVAANHRGQGIGRNLLRSVEAYAQEKWKKQQHVNLKFVANTLTILEDAASLYEKCGYRTEKDTRLGDMLVLRTYTKEAGSEHH